MGERNRRKGAGRRGLARLIFIACFLVLAAFIVHQWVEIYAVGLQKEQTQKQLDDLLAQQQLLQSEQMLLQDQEYIEKVAREELGMVREGEVPYVPLKSDVARLPR